MTAAEQKVKIQAIKDWLATGSINIFGLPFSGKDTHGEILAEELDGVLIGGGAILRSMHEHAHIQAQLATGMLTPTEEYLAAVTPYLSQDRFKDSPLILSTVGRWKGEEKSIIASTAASGHPIVAVVYLDVPDKTVWQRWRESDRGRHDDKAEHIFEKRLEEFYEKTLPVIEVYRSMGILITIDATPPINDVSDDIIDKLYDLSQR